MIGASRFFWMCAGGESTLPKGHIRTGGDKWSFWPRLDFGGAPHRNPDGEEVGSPHLHLYREGYGDKWACPVPPDHFSNLDDLWLTLQEFMRFCNIAEPPFIKRGLFI